MFNTSNPGPGFVVVDTIRDNVKLLFTGTGNLNTTDLTYITLRIGTPAQHQPFRFTRVFLTQKSTFFELILNSLPQDKGALESIALSGVDPNLFGILIAWETDNRIHSLGLICQVLAMATCFQMQSTMSRVLGQLVARQQELAMDNLELNQIVNFAYGSSDLASTSLIRKVVVRNYVALPGHSWDYLFSDYPRQFALDVLRDMKEFHDSLPEGYRAKVYTADDL